MFISIYVCMCACFNLYLCVNAFICLYVYKINVYRKLPSVFLVATINKEIIGYVLYEYICMFSCVYMCILCIYIYVNKIHVYRTFPLVFLLNKEIIGYVYI
jgi:hypothetical protein